MPKNITLSISDILFSKMKKFPYMKWSEVARNAIEERIDMLETLNTMAAKSKLTVEDAETIGKKIKRGIARRHGLIK